jgi:hypothetical protein
MKANILPSDTETATFPIDIAHYDRTPDLSPEERVVLTRITRQLSQGKQARQLVEQPQLHRLIAPLLDLCQLLQIERGEAYRRMTPFLVEMHRRGISFWGWSEAEWIESIGLTRQAWKPRHGNASHAPRMEFLAAAYLFGGFSHESRVPTRQHFFCPVSERSLWHDVDDKNRGTAPTALSHMGLCFQYHVSAQLTSSCLTGISGQPECAIGGSLS